MRNELAPPKDPLDRLMRGWNELDNPWKFLWLIVPGLLLFLIVVHRPQLPDPKTPDINYGIRPDVVEPVEATVTRQGEWTSNPEVFAPISKDASLRIETLPGPWIRANLQLIGDTRQDWTVRFTREIVGHDGPEFWSYRVPSVTPGERITLPEWSQENTDGLPLAWSPLVVELSPRGEVAEGTQLQRMNLRLSATPTDVRPFNFAGMFGIALFPLALTGFLVFSRRRTLQHASSFAGVFAILAVIFSTFDLRVLEFGLPASGAFFIGAAVAAGVRGWQERGSDAGAAQLLINRACWFLFAAIMVWGMLFRWEVFLQERLLPLLPDARGYREIALTGSFYETVQAHAPWVREPLFPAVLRLWYAFAPTTQTSGRFATWLIGLLPVALLFVIGRRLFGNLVGLLAAGWVVFNPYLAGVSCSLLRDDLLTTIFLLLLAVPVFFRDWPWGRAILFGVIGGALALLRINNIALLIPFVAYEAWRGRWKPMEILLVFLIAVLPLVPHLMFNARQGGGDAMYSSNVHVRYYVNRDMIGEPGFPATRGEWAADPYAGETMSTFDMFRLYGPAEAIWRTAHGYVKIFLFDFPYRLLFYHSKLLMLFGLAGAWVLWRRKDLWWVVAWFVLFAFPVAFIASIGLDYRLAVPMMPIIVWTWAAGVAWVGEKVWRRTKWAGARVTEATIS